ncbi:MAG: hypothetical protein IT392_10645 [Nitrospirae bacterium]|nr:hypothetical protein [Nitrospirota bacterium]
MTRRRLLKVILLFVIVSVYTTVLWRSEWGRYHILRIVKPRLKASSQTGVLSIREKETIIAFGEVLVKEKSLTEEERKYFIEHIDYRTQNTPGYLSIYRRTANLLNRLANSNFSTLDLNDRVTVVISNHLNSHHVKGWEYLNLFRRQDLTIRTYVVPDIIKGFYSSPAGWAIVGYKTFPGRCSSQFRYTHSEV